MKVVVVRFPGSHRTYEYKTEMQLIKNAVYDILVDDVTTYSSPITVLGYRSVPEFKGNLRQITNATCLSAPKLPDDNIEKVIFNEEKRTTVVIWKDGVKTILKCSPEDTFDKEKALALAYMKRMFNNRSAFNEVLKKWTKED